MFDSREQFKFKIFSGGEKDVTVRFPTDQELCQRTKEFKNVRRDLGRGQSTFEIVNAEEVEFRCFKKIRVDTDSDVELDEHEAKNLMERLLDINVSDSHRNGANTFVVSLNVFKDAEVIHTLKMPTQKEVFEFKRDAVKGVQAKRHVDVRYSLDPVLRLWDRLNAGTEGYAEGSEVPVVHKEKALWEVMDLMQELTEGSSDPER